MNNVCIVGYGSIGPVHANAISKTERLELPSNLQLFDILRLFKYSMKVNLVAFLNVLLK